MLIIREFYTKDDLEQAKRENIVYYLKSIGYELKKEGHYYRSVPQDSIVIHECGRYIRRSDTNEKIATKIRQKRQLKRSQ